MNGYKRASSFFFLSPDLLTVLNEVGGDVQVAATRISDGQSTVPFHDFALTEMARHCSALGRSLAQKGQKGTRVCSGLQSFSVSPKRLSWRSRRSWWAGWSWTWWGCNQGSWGSSSRQCKRSCFSHRRGRRQRRCLRFLGFIKASCQRRVCQIFDRVARATCILDGDFYPARGFNRSNFSFRNSLGLECSSNGSQRRISSSKAGF